MRIGIDMDNTICETGKYLIDKIYEWDKFNGRITKKCKNYKNVYQMFGLYLYVTYQTLLIIQGKTVIMLVGSFVGSLVRCLLCLIFIHSNIALFVFGIANFVDFYIRNIVYRIGVFRYSKNRTKNKNSIIIKRRSYGTG